MSVSFPGHSSPPLWGGGLLQLLVRVTLLPPHDFAQADQSVQSDHWPLTGPAGKERILPPFYTNTDILLRLSLLLSVWQYIGMYTGICMCNQMVTSEIRE